MWWHGEIVHKPRAVMRAAGGPRRYDLVMIAASAGGIKALEQLLSALPADFPVPIAVVQHRTTRQPNLLARVLSRHTSLAVKLAEPSEAMQPGTVYLAPPDLHLIVGRDQRLAFIDGHRIRHVLSSANPLFASAAEVFGGRVIAVVLTGWDRDATDGVQTVKVQGGIVIAQDRTTSESFAMPHSAIETGCVDYVLPLEAIAPALVRLVTAPVDADADPRPGPVDAR